MNKITDTSALPLLACDDGFDPIEDRLRANIRSSIEARTGQLSRPPTLRSGGRCGEGISPRPPGSADYGDIRHRDDQRAPRPRRERGRQGARAA